MSTIAEAGLQESPGRGVLWMLGAGLCFVSLDSLAKDLSQSYTVVQIVWARYTFHFLLLGLFLGPRLSRTLYTRRPGLQIIRSLLLLGSTSLCFVALRFVPLADTTAIMFVVPILVTALSVPLLGEQVGVHRWASVAIGFLGTLIIVRPGTDAMDPAALFALGAAGCYALYQVATRRLSATDGPLTTLAYSAVPAVLVTSAWVPFFWIVPTMPDWLAMIGLGLFGGVGHFALIKAFQTAPAATIAPFSYANLIWATLFGYLVFADLPDSWTVLGAVIIAGSGLYIVHRERLRAGSAMKAKAEVKT